MTSRRSRKPNSHHLIVPEVPTLITITRDRRHISTMSNERPLKPGQEKRARNRKEFDRGQFGRRVQYMPIGDVHDIPYDTDADHIALMLHQKKIGMNYEYRYHWLHARDALMKAVEEISAETGIGHEYIDYDELERGYETQWSIKHMTRSALNACKTMPVEDVERVNRMLVQSNGSASSVVEGMRVLTEIEMELNAQNRLCDTMAEAAVNEAREFDKFNVFHQVVNAKRRTLNDKDDEFGVTPAPRIDAEMRALGACDLSKGIGDNEHRNNGSAKKSKVSRDDMMFGEQQNTVVVAATTATADEMSKLRAEFLRRGHVRMSMKKKKEKPKAKAPAKSLEKKAWPSPSDDWSDFEKIKKSREQMNGGGGGVFDFDSENN